ncbi:conserved hypothetical protein [Candidatus Competibacter denitrificans Run_A_D11]|uniref:PcRGLX/YetA-like N-terminal RIFT barrel domain-containing protein n=1 Tax=Candidatus Competibacter denitrificans Run_A_D11 TaxID=1400863 RepID=W6ME42_9GAMM|nr:hypothetical protein [Candidatus Competibacter denitrificans]CDI03958.1 conserved hypothetical protein [Candidatus Competibacter denitrificans Run_A_D11]
MTHLHAPVWLQERHGFARRKQPVRIGIPLCHGQVFDSAETGVIDHTGSWLPSQARPLSWWPDRSIKWLLVDFLADLQAGERAGFTVVSKSQDKTQTAAIDQFPVLSWQESAEALVVSTGIATFSISKTVFLPFNSIQVDGVEILSESGSATRLLDRNGKQYRPVIERWLSEQPGPWRASWVAEGSFWANLVKSPLRFKARLTFFAGMSYVCVELLLRNPQAAVHSGGLWDLGDPNSFFFTDLSMDLQLVDPIEQLKWYAELPSEAHSANFNEWTLYQDSSGGKNWNSPNHIDCFGNLSVGFCGYRVESRKDGKIARLAEGQRATPALHLISASSWLAATVQDFWQNFPKALRYRDGKLSVALFPNEGQKLYELQGGEQKRHTIFVDVGLGSQKAVLAQLQHPIQVWVDPSWVEKTAAVSYFVSQPDDPNHSYIQYIDSLLEGPNSLLNKREIIDEYGWRNFGDLYADHEAVHHLGPEVLVSHYNNQYDFIYGAAIHFLRTGDGRWRLLLEAAARHLIDIDIYHTNQDKAAYNHGLFWHTDHYKPAGTCTHRTYSRQNGISGNYGGGPSNEHNYTSGLLFYYYLTGDPEAAEAILELAAWVFGMDDGTQTLLGLLDEGPTGGASQTVSTLYHKPGRGAGNSINALLDAYRLTVDRRYLSKAEDIIQRCIHPYDDIPALKLDEPEYRWSYLAFLQVLGKYLDSKLEWGELDYNFYYVRDAFLHYAEWMLKNETPYKDVLHKVEIPTETWPAHDIRKSHIFHVAAKHAPPDQYTSFTEKACFFFERCLSDVCSFDTAFLTRPQVILAVYGYIHAYFQKHGKENADYRLHGYHFGEPENFLPQKARAKATLQRKLKVAIAELKRLVFVKGQILKPKHVKNP